MTHILFLCFFYLCPCLFQICCLNMRLCSATGVGEMVWAEASANIQAIINLLLKGRWVAESMCIQNQLYN